jgi:hypothetical protein
MPLYLFRFQLESLLDEVGHVGLERQRDNVARQAVGDGAALLA